MYAPQAYTAFLFFPPPPTPWLWDMDSPSRTPITDLRAATMARGQQHNCDFIPRLGTVVLLKVSFLLQSLLPRMRYYV